MQIARDGAGREVRNSEEVEDVEEEAEEKEEEKKEKKAKEERAKAKDRGIDDFPAGSCRRLKGRG